MARPIRRVALLLLLLSAASSYAATPREMYESALTRAKALRSSGATSSPDAALAKRYRAAIAAFENVARRYPTSSYSDNALWEAARLATEAHERFGDEREETAASRLLKWLVAQYPSSALAARGREELKRLEGRGSAASASLPAKAPAPSISSPGGPASVPVKVAATSSAPNVSAPVVLRDISRSITGDVARVTIQLDDEVMYRSERLENPPRVLFDLASTRLGPAVAEGTISYSGELVRHVRVGRHPNQVTRVVLDLSGVRRYSVFSLYSPYRIVVDCERDRTAPAATATMTAASVRAVAPPLPTEKIAEERLAPPPPETELVEEAPRAPLVGRPVLAAAAMRAPVALAPSIPAVPAVVAPAPSPLRTTRTIAPTRRMPAWRPAIVKPAPLESPPTLLASSSSVKRGGSASSPVTTTSSAAGTSSSAPKPAGSAPKEASHSAEQPITPSLPPAVPSNGFSMARQLGLGASRIVIDPGHGGHDPGAEGPGLFEAEVVLDVALRLEKLLRSGGSEVVLTRRTNEYIALEERTAIANRAQGDLFLSIHANASRNRAARGIETYFLNFATNPDAEAVAARENASTGRTMSSLTDIVKAITLNNKLDESKSFAAVVQREVVAHLKGSNSGARNHGVKQAPFVVLIGASMPSVLVEVSFITNRQEGRLLKSGAYRQKIAEGLFDAIRGYQKSLKTTAAATNQ